jgi:transcriptional regulator with XRE-family HTH domain
MASLKERRRGAQRAPCVTEAISPRSERALNLIVVHLQARVMKDNETKVRFMELRAQGLPLAKIAAEIKVSKTTLINWDRDFKEEIDNLRAVELEAMYDKYDLSTRKKVEFFGDVLSRIQRELETRDLSSIPTEKLFTMYAHFYREARHTLPEIKFNDENPVRAVKLILNPAVKP